MTYTTHGENDNFFSSNALTTEAKQVEARENRLNLIERFKLKNKHSHEFDFSKRRKKRFFIEFISRLFMASVGAAYIRKQPQAQDIHNSFGLMGNENLLRTWEFKEGTCGCSGSHYTALTDTRLLLRSEDTTCCTCCSEPKHVDASIFLRDIAEMRESRQSDDCCTRCCPQCCLCCCSSPKHMEVRGTFGSEILHVSKQDMARVQVEIPAAIGNHKLVSQY